MIIINELGFDSKGVDEGRKILGRLVETIEKSEFRLDWGRYLGNVEDAMLRIIKEFEKWRRSRLVPVGGEMVVRGVVVTGGRIEIRLVSSGEGLRVAGSPVAGGITIAIIRRPDGGLDIEIDTYVERLVCLNGLTRKEKHRYRINHQGELEEVVQRVARDFPRIQTEICREMLRYYAAQHRNVPSIESALERVRDLWRKHGLDNSLFDWLYCAFMAEPGTSVFHVANAVAKLANDHAGIRHRISPDNVVRGEPSRFPPLQSGDTEVYRIIQKIAGEALEIDYGSDVSTDETLASDNSESESDSDMLKDCVDEVIAMGAKAQHVGRIATDCCPPRNPYREGTDYNAVFQRLMCEPHLTELELCAWFMAERNKTRAQAEASVIDVVTSPRKEGTSVARGGDIRGNYAAQGHLYYVEKDRGGKLSVHPRIPPMERRVRPKG